MSATRDSGESAPLDLAALVAAIRDAAAKPPPLLMTAEEAAEYLGISRALLYRLVARRELPAPLDIPQCGSKWRRSDLEKWAAKLRPRRGKPTRLGPTQQQTESA